MSKKKLPLTYQEESARNEDTLKEILKKARPDIYVLMDILDNTGINPYVVFHHIRALNNIYLGTGYGNVITSVENKIVTFIRSDEAVKLNENLVKPKL